MTRPKKSNRQTHDDIINISRQIDEQENRNQTFPSYLIHLLPRFAADQNESIEDFFNQAENIFMLHPAINNQIKGILIKSRMDKSAAEFILHDPIVKESNEYDVIKKALLHRYTKKQTLLKGQDQFNKIVHLPNMSVADLAQDIKEKASKLVGSGQHSEEMRTYLNQIMLGKFLQVIRSDIKIELLKDDINDFNKAVERAETLESVFQSVEAEEKVKKPDMDQLLAQLEICKISEDVKKLKEHQEHQKEEIVRCQICSRPRHTAITCYYRNENLYNQNAPNTRNFRQNPNRRANFNRGTSTNFRSFRTRGTLRSRRNHLNF